MLGGTQLGITMASLGLGFVAEPLVGHLLEEVFDPASGLPLGLRHALSYALALAIVVFFHMVFAEMVPKNAAIAEPERGALALALPFRLYLTVFRPLIVVLSAAAKAILRPLGVEPRNEVTVLAGADEISAMLEASRDEGVIREFEHRLLSGALGFGQLHAGAVMVPRPDIAAVSSEAPVSDVEGIALANGYSRLPVFEADLDHVRGFVHVKDLYRIPPERWSRRLPDDLVREMLVVPESRNLFDLLADMRRARKHFALVVDEFGSTAGVVTLEDVLEELVGDIRDEYDRRARRVRRVGRFRFVVDGGLRLDEVRSETDLDLPPGEYETVGGYVLSRLGRVPEVGDEVAHDGWWLRVRRVDGRRVALVEVTAPSPSADAAGEGGGESEGR